MHRSTAAKNLLSCLKAIKDESFFDLKEVQQPQSSRHKVKTTAAKSGNKREMSMTRVHMETVVSVHLQSSFSRMKNDTKMSRELCGIFLEMLDCDYAKYDKHRMLKALDPEGFEWFHSTGRNHICSYFTAQARNKHKGRIRSSFSL
ncbi:hypothetical protein VTP01DRAFT_8075 [Rhizomucor pusillus]|uniref:uncharacterized protein n=1 Tax=Rhizomucor pusillus TaxID=4840 RepID=UPI003742A10C